jgi:O6-methylguanine-DNA--protein-cysteine methyltransferase
LWKVTTYKAIADFLKVHHRAVANILRHNHNYKYPCYKVICNNGLIGGYNLGVNKKIDLLKKEGIPVLNKKVSKDYIFISFK